MTKTRLTYLSIDLDYWCDRSTGMLPFIHRALALPVPIVVVGSHEKLLPYVNDSGATRLVNIDYHDDLAASRDNRGRFEWMLECGSWVSFVKWRNRGVYEWWRPSHGSRLEGVCDTRFDLYNGQRHLCGWMATKERKRATLRLPSNIVGVGIAISCDYWTCSYHQYAPLIHKWFPSFEPSGLFWTWKQRDFLNEVHLVLKE